MKYQCLAVLSGFLWHSATAQHIADSATFARAAASVKKIPPITNTTRQLPLPAAPAGYSLQLKGTDRLPVIDREGHITTPLVDVPVSLYFVLQRHQDSATMDVPNITVTVPGKYAARTGNPTPFVIPALREWYGGKGNYTLPGKPALVIDPRDTAALLPGVTVFKADLQQLTGIPQISIRTGQPRKGDIYFSLRSADQALGKEGYQLEIAEDIRIRAMHPQGAFWATRTLLQLLEQDRQHRHIPQGITRDYPKYAVRGFVLDAGRKFFSMDFLRHYVKFMAYYKMNDFHIHLNDNGFKQFFGNNWDSTYAAFRLENSTFPGLTAKDGSYSKKAFIALQDLADSCAVKIIPEIDVPAHSLAFTKVVPQTASLSYGRDHLNLDSASYDMIDKVFREYLQGPEPVFKGDEVHIGTDEYAKKEAEKFRAFTDHYIRYVESFGKKVRMWGSLTHAQGSTPVKSAGVTMNAWYNGYAEPADMMRQGYDLISTPDGWLYIVPAAGYYHDYLNVAKIYQQWEPNMIGDAVFPMGHPQIKGGAFAVWNDHPGNGITEQDVHDRVFPSMQVLAEKMWNGHTSQSDYQQFAAHSRLIGEGPGLNMRAKITSRDSLALQYDFSDNRINDISGNKRAALQQHQVGISPRKTLVLQGGSSYIKTPLTEVGYPYSVEFDIQPAADNQPGAVLFSSPHAVVTYQDGKIAFSREGYHYHFNYRFHADSMTHVRISGNNKGTSLFINGRLAEKLEGAMRSFPGTKDRNMIIQTLVFPLQTIGDSANAFKGEIDNLKVIQHP
ncbi:hexosaminidase [Chitinophaga eiseniae]|uniref:Hexosaminidase n=1 Tax=Chitinophaga eiseniae TaxID=634771 RepID=A0A1T4QD95_9BACT|nr:family 20 glycosylhydrolase [Chitinophaga eiseniae]SKA01665.1 hexosaminidase [Chitinophaga eiseniae]